MKPDNFSWIDSSIAGSAQPYTKDNIDFLLAEQVTHLISLTPQKPLMTRYMGTEINHHHLPVFATPDDQQVKQFIELVKSSQAKNEKIVVHCQFGQERTGIFLVIYLVEVGGLDVREAIEVVRDKRPSSLRTQASIRYLLSKYSI